MKPLPGIYRDVDAAQYRKWDAASASRLKALRRSALHMRHRIDAPEESDELTRGSAAHAAVLQPDVFAATYALGPDVKLNTKEGKAEWAAFAEANPGRVLLRGAEVKRVIDMRAAVWSHPAARKILGGAGECELSVVWTCPESRVLCKLRCDRLCAGESIVLDIKTTQDASRAAFQRSIERYGYHVQGAHYLNGLAAAGNPVEYFVIIAVESDTPHAVQVFMLDDEALAIGRAEAANLLKRYAECERSGAWPGYSDRIELVSLPPWAMRETD